MPRKSKYEGQMDQEQMRMAVEASKQTVREQELEASEEAAEAQELEEELRLAEIAAEQKREAEERGEETERQIGEVAGE